MYPIFYQQVDEIEWDYSAPQLKFFDSLGISSVKWNDILKYSMSMTIKTEATGNFQECENIAEVSSKKNENINQSGNSIPSAADAMQALFQVEPNPKHRLKKVPTFVLKQKQSEREQSSLSTMITNAKNSLSDRTNLPRSPGKTPLKKLFTPQMQIVTPVDAIVNGLKNHFCKFNLEDGDGRKVLQKPQEPLVEISSSSSKENEPDHKVLLSKIPTVQFNKMTQSSKPIHLETISFSDSDSSSSEDDNSRFYTSLQSEDDDDNVSSPLLFVEESVLERQPTLVINETGRKAPSPSGTIENESNDLGAVQQDFMYMSPPPSPKQKVTSSIPVSCPPCRKKVDFDYIIQSSPSRNVPSFRRPTQSYLAKRKLRTPKRF